MSHVNEPQTDVIIRYIHHHRRGSIPEKLLLLNLIMWSPCWGKRGWTSFIGETLFRFRKYPVVALALECCQLLHHVSARGGGARKGRPVNRPFKNGVTPLASDLQPLLGDCAECGHTDLRSSSQADGLFTHSAVHRRRSTNVWSTRAESTTVN